MFSIQYLLESAFSLGCFYILYWLFLRRETFFHWNRWYLMSAAFLSLLIPAIKIRLEAPVPQDVSGLNRLQVVVQHTQSAPVAVERQLSLPLPSQVSLTWGDLFTVIYQMVALALLVVLTMRLYRLIRFIRRCKKEKKGGFTLAEAKEGPTPVASFFSYVFWNKENISEQDRLIFEHELVHARQWHSLDVLFMETLLVWQWFNPLVYIYRKSLQTIHEYIADAHVVQQTQEPYTYATLLANQYLTNEKPAILNTFHFQLKHRLRMIAKQPSAPLRRARYLLALPLAIALMLLFSFRLLEKTNLGASVSEAIRSVEKITQNAAQTTIFTFSDPVKKPVNEPSPYIFYWGSLQTRFTTLPGTGKFEAELYASAAEFREALKREPRLWNGTTLEQHFALVVNQIPVKTDYYNEAVYSACRKSLEEMVGTLKPNDQVLFDQIALPNGKTGQITLYLSEKDPKWLPRNAYEVNFQTDPGKLILKDYDKTVWGDAEIVLDRQFYTVDEFWNIVAMDPKAVNYDGSLSRLNHFALRVANETNTLIGLANPEGRKGQTMAEIRQQLEGIRDKIKPGCSIYLNGQVNADPTVDTIVGLDGKLSVFNNFYQQLAGFTLVEKQDPRLNLRWSDQHDYYIEWGNVSLKSGSFYARSFYENVSGTTIYADRFVSSTNNSMTAKNILEMVELPFRLMDENQNILKPYQFQFSYQNKSWTITENGPPPEMVQYLKNNLKAYETITLDQFKSGDLDLSQFSIILETRAENPKPPLRPAHTKDVNTGNEQIKLFPPEPNPGTDDMHLRIYVATNCRAQLNMTDAQGKMVWNTLRDLEQGVTRVELPLSNLSPGWYVVSVDSPLGRVEKKLIKE